MSLLRLHTIVPTKIAKTRHLSSTPLPRNPLMGTLPMAVPRQMNSVTGLEMASPAPYPAAPSLPTPSPVGTSILGQEVPPVGDPAPSLVPTVAPTVGGVQTRTVPVRVPVVDVIGCWLQTWAMRFWKTLQLTPIQRLRPTHPHPLSFRLNEISGSARKRRRSDCTRVLSLVLNRYKVSNRSLPLSRAHRFTRFVKLFDLLLPPLTLIQPPIGHVDAGPILMGPDSTPPPWSTAEQEKQHLYDKAQAAVRRIQGTAYSPPPGSTTKPASVGATLYHNAIIATQREPQNTQQHSSPERSAAIPQYSPPQTEKEMVKRYYDAKAAASRNQGQDYVQAEPISYDALYPSDPPKTGMTSRPSNLEQPPSFVSGQDDPPMFTSGSQHPILSEKERMRRHYEAQDAAANSVVSSPTSIPTPVYMPSPQPAQVMSPRFQQFPATLPQNNSSPPPLSNPTTPMNALTEKEMLRRKYEAEDAARQVQNPPTRMPPTTPTRSGSALPPIPRVPSIKASFPGRPLTAAEEKAQLAARYANSSPGSPPSTGRSFTATEEKPRFQAQYEARDQVTSPPIYPQQIQTPVSAFSNVNPNNTLPNPPPLKPRPPVDYINRTKEEDDRTHSQYLELQRAGSLGSPRERVNTNHSRQFSLEQNGNGNPYTYES